MRVNGESCMLRAQPIECFGGWRYQYPVLNDSTREGGGGG